VTNSALFLVEERIADLGLQIAIEKTDAVLFTSRYKYVEPEIGLCGNHIPLSPEMFYLGIAVNRSLLFKSHAKIASAKAAKIGAQLARIMPNVGGPREDTCQRGSCGVLGNTQQYIALPRQLGFWRGEYLVP